MTGPRPLKLQFVRPSAGIIESNDNKSEKVQYYNDAGVITIGAKPKFNVEPKKTFFQNFFGKICNCKKRV